MGPLTKFENSKSPLPEHLLTYHEFHSKQSMADEITPKQPQSKILFPLSFTSLASGHFIACAVKED